MPTSSPTFWAQCVCADLSCRSDLYCARVGDAPTSELAHPLQAQRYLCIASSVQDILQCLAGSRFVHLCYELRRGKQGVARRPQFQAFGVFLEIFWIGGHPQALGHAGGQQAVFPASHGLDVGSRRQQVKPHGQAIVHGSIMVTPVLRKSLSFRVTTVRSRLTAIPASIASGK